MITRHRFVLPVLLLWASTSVASPLMHRTQTVISVPPPGEVVALSALHYKSKLFEAKVTSVKLTLTSAEGADPVVGEWMFLASNSDGQMHKVEIFTRLLDESGSQILMASKVCMLGGGYQDFACPVPLNVKAADWAKTKSLRIVTDWQS
ncbi:MAG: hypothetical protein ABW056_05450 [Thermoanaerobaculia bacterium]